LQVKIVISPVILNLPKGEFDDGVRLAIAGKSSRFIGIACDNAITSASVLGNLAIELTYFASE